MYNPSYAEQLARGIFIFHPDLDPEACPLYDVDAIVIAAPPIRQKRTGYMSKRFQRGSVFSVGKMWHGRYWQDVPGKEKREHPLVVLGERKEMTKLEARK